jgi:hypothetical protein
MRAILRRSTVVIIVAVLCACAAGGMQERNAPLPAVSADTSPQAKKGSGVLYVDDGGNRSVEIFGNGTWKKVGSITNGVGPDVDRNWVDANGNLYVAQFSPADVVEYAPGGTSPSFTYDSQMQLPMDVTTDRAGNVYEADELTSSVNEYAQQSNSLSATCGGGGLTLSVAVDGSGDVFVAYAENNGDGHVIEYSGGLSGCHATELGLTLGFPGGMALDKKGDIIICDQGNNAVDIIAPPYKSISGTLGSSYSAPSSVRINRMNDRAYVVNENPPRDVFILKYPNGSLIKKLGAKNGISGPAGAVDSDNFNP